MKIILSNKFFIISFFLVILQQIAVGLSTYFIGLAGITISKNIMESFDYIIVFFSLILLAYFLGSASLFFRTKLSNDAWGNYYKKTLTEISKNHALSSDKNKRKTNLWISGESLSTLNEAGFAFVDIIAIYFNVFFTIIAMFFVIGYVLSLMIMLCMLLSVTLLCIYRNKINVLAGEIQNNKITALSSIEKIWDNIFYGNSFFSCLAYQDASEKTKKFFNMNEKYKIIEQVISCLPILFSIPVIVIISYYQVSNNYVSIGALVAVLPRSIQLFQNIHAASMSSSQLILLKNKLSNLDFFVSQLDLYDYNEKIDNEKIEIYNLFDGNRYNVNSFMDFLISNECSFGRFLIKGNNGVGKSTLLKSIKSKHPESLFLGPGIEIGNLTNIGSTGQRQLSQLNILINKNGLMILLDEWDSNLDQVNTKKMDEILNTLSHSNIIIEVRHKKQ
ncbi:hypothetical protein PSI19_05415 [Xenorhabdus khoisanae]|uniref:hypothetical protein n=1 Tax=Xenorhabdus khoisanae TaxID=880157 RepID=UPI002359669A|nr:hypothetical protein [Xenorhabdus khoisanae]MDC9613334.1 hypothetical protein [Xenorhabdus khoisanae]